MPTRPLEKLLDRDFSKVAAQELIDIACPLLQELVNHATNAWRRCETSISGSENEDLAVVFLYLHIIELTDGIEVLLRHSCPVPAIPLLRSCFEALVYMEYILETDAEYVRRSLAWLAGYAHERLKARVGFDPSTQRGRAVQEDLQSSQLLQFLPTGWPSASRAREAAQPLQRLLQRPQFKAIEAEYRKRGKCPWYQLFGGPATIEQICARSHKGRLAQYEFLYRHWSSVAHAGDISRFITTTAAGERAIWSLRNPKEFQIVALFASIFMLDATRLMLARFRPTESIRGWYIREVRDRFLKLGSLETKVTGIT